MDCWVEEEVEVECSDLAVYMVEPEREREFSAERSKNGKREQSRKKREFSRFFRD